MSRKDITQTVVRAKRDISWLASIHIVLRSTENTVVPRATELLVAPEIHLGIANYPPMEARRVRERICQAFNLFCEAAGEMPREEVGTYLNRSVVIYTDAVLQGALLDIARLGLDKELSKRTVGAQIEELSESVEGFNSTPHVNVARLIAQLRHVCVHKSGIADNKFMTHCTQDRLWEGTGIWQSEDDFRDDYVEGKKAPLTIEKVIVPLMKGCLDFLDDSGKIVIQHIENQDADRAPMT